MNAGHNGPAKTFTPVNLSDVNLRAGGMHKRVLPDDHPTTLLALSGKVMLDGEREALEGDPANVSRAGNAMAPNATTGAKLLVMGGEPTAKNLSCTPPGILLFPGIAFAVRGTVSWFPPSHESTTDQVV